METFNLRLHQNLLLLGVQKSYEESLAERLLLLGVQRSYEKNFTLFVT